MQRVYTVGNRSRLFPLIKHRPVAWRAHESAHKAFRHHSRSAAAQLARARPLHAWMSVAAVLTSAERIRRRFEFTVCIAEARCCGYCRPKPTLRRLRSLRGHAKTQRLPMTEREKMLAGQFYDPFDAELVAARTRARDLCHR